MTTPLKRARPDFVRYGPDRIREAVGFEDVVEPVARALTDFSRGLGEAPVAMFAPMGHDGDVHVKAACELVTIAPCDGVTGVVAASAAPATPPAAATRTATR